MAIKASSFSSRTADEATFIVSGAPFPCSIVCSRTSRPIAWMASTCCEASWSDVTVGAIASRGAKFLCGWAECGRLELADTGRCDCPTASTRGCGCSAMASSSAIPARRSALLPLGEGDVLFSIFARLRL
eukprot:scaffold17278_cov32-Tisochrysis_lutea.AAC.2